jgi:sec-independent protein translocase protein TatA
LIIILVVVLIIFGPGKLPEIGGALGKGIREFRQSTSEALNDDTPTRTVVTVTARAVKTERSADQVDVPVAQPSDV